MADLTDLTDHTAALAQRIRADLHAGATLDEVLGALRAERCGPLMAMAALKRATGMGLGAAKIIVSEFCEGRSFAHLTLAELDALGDAPRVAGVNSQTSGARDHAIMYRKPWLLYARLGPGVVAAAASSMPLAALPADRRHGTINGSTVSFEGVVAAARLAAAACPSEIAIERDEPDQMLVHFLRAMTP